MKLCSSCHDTWLQCCGHILLLKWELQPDTTTVHRCELQGNYPQQAAVILASFPMQQPAPRLMSQRLCGDYRWKLRFLCARARRAQGRSHASKLLFTHFLVFSFWKCFHLPPVSLDVLAVLSCYIFLVTPHSSAQVRRLAAGSVFHVAFFMRAVCLLCCYAYLLHVTHTIAGFS